MCGRARASKWNCASVRSVGNSERRPPITHIGLKGSSQFSGSSMDEEAIVKATNTSRCRVPCGALLAS